VPGGPAKVWIFAYGSLMWRPGFAHDEVLDARLYGYHRALCVYSWVHRGTRERPGLVLGLDRGGSCRGRALAIPRQRETEVLSYLDERELVTSVYRRRLAEVTTARGRLPAWCYVVRREHQQYAGKLDPERVLALVRDGVGHSGRCRDYLLSTVTHLEELGVLDGPLHWLARQLGREA
jgi:cation transport protein ChaC